MALTSFMRLSSMKAAHVALAWRRVLEIRVSRSFFARCGIPQTLMVLFMGPRTGGSAAVESHISRKTSEIPDFLYVAQARTACAAFLQESRMKLISATKLHRKSGGVGHPSSVEGTGLNTSAPSLPGKDGAVKTGTATDYTPVA